MKESNQRKVGAMLTYVSIIASVLVGLLYTPFLIGKLGQSEYGLYSLVASIIGYLTVLDLGFSDAIVVFASKYRAKEDRKAEQKLYGMFRIIFVVLGIVVAIIGLLLFLNVSNMFSATMTDNELSKMKVMMLILTFNLAITFIFSLYSAILRTYEKFIFQRLLSILNTLLKPLLMIPLLFLGYQSVAMCVVITIVNIFVLVSNYVYCRFKLNLSIKYYGFDKKLFWEMGKYSFFLFLTTIVDKVNWSVDQFILGIYCGTVAVSVYSIASQLNTMFINLSTAISSVLLPKISRMVAKNASSEDLTNEMIKVGRIQYYVIFLMASGLVLFGKNFISLWVGPGFEEAYQISLILILPLCCPLIQNIGNSIMLALNKYKFKAVSSAIMSVFNIIISVILAQKYGATGAAIGTAIAVIVCGIIIINIYYYTVLKLNVIKFWKQIFNMTIRFIPAILILLIVQYFFRLDGIVAFLFYGFFYVIIYFIFAYTLCLNDYEKQFVDKVAYKIFKKKK